MIFQYFVTSDMTEVAPTIQMVPNEHPHIDSTALQGAKIRIVNSEEVSAPRKIITLNQQQYIVNQGMF